MQKATKEIKTYSYQLPVSLMNEVKRIASEDVKYGSINHCILVVIDDFVKNYNAAKKRKEQ